MKKKDDQLTFRINYVNRVYPIIIMVLCLMIIGGLYIVNSEVLEANSLISELQRTDTVRGDEASEVYLRIELTVQHNRLHLMKIHYYNTYDKCLASIEEVGGKCYSLSHNEGMVIDPLLELQNADLLALPQRQLSPDYDPNVCDHIQTHCGDDGQCKETCDMDAE